MMHHSLSLFLESKREKNPESFFFWITEWGHAELFNSPSKPVPEFWETYHCMPAHCLV
jgi:hypothetical protein